MQPFRYEGSGVVCSEGHRFDRAKQGYLNLLPAHHKGSKAPGDDRAMLLARRDFLQAGHYRPLVQLLAEKMLISAESAPASITCLDCGCGEGYYLNSLSDHLAANGYKLNGFGSDIAKDAVKLASSSYKQLNFAVASNFKLPVESSCVDILLRIFAPGDSSEVTRVLASGGEFWRVVPGPNHLQELKTHLYDRVNAHDLPSTPDGFAELESCSVEYDLVLDDNASVNQLLAMTPFSWQGSSEKQAALRSLNSLSVTVSFVFQRYGVAS